MSGVQIQTALDENRLPDEYRWVRERLEQEFREYHEGLRTTPANSFDVDNMSGVEFESWIRRLFDSKGFEVHGTPRSGDQGADLIARRRKDNVIQAKRHRSAVGNRAVQEVIGAVAHYRADKGCVITNATFTRSARLSRRATVLNSLMEQN